MADPALNEEIEETGEGTEDSGINDLTNGDELNEVESDEIDESKTVESWLEEEGDDSERTDSTTVPLYAHVKAKKKLRGTINEQKDEITRLKEENEALKSGQSSIESSTKLQLPKRPRRVDFDFDDDYEKALDKYEEEKEEIKFNQLSQNQNLNASRAKAQENLDMAVNSHYERAEKLLESSGISEDAFRTADRTIRESIETISPGRGDTIADQMIEMIGEGSEKVFYKLGNPKNKGLRGEMIAILAADPSGLKLASFLGEQKALLNNNNIRRGLSKAPPPDNQFSGDESTPNKERALKKQYQTAHKKGDGSAAWKARSAAKKLGIDVSAW